MPLLVLEEEEEEAVAANIANGFSSELLMVVCLTYFDMRRTSVPFETDEEENDFAGPCVSLRLIMLDEMPVPRAFYRTLPFIC